MNYMPRINRRSFVVGSAALGGGLALGFELPFGPSAAHAEVGGPEVNAWVVVRPDETVVIRIARSEMGQGTLTGLAQLVAEELECDWSKVTYEFPTPGQNVARKRVWGDFFTAGSRGIRASNEFVRKGGAAARMMLIASRRERMEGAGRGVRRRERRDHAQGLEPQHDLRQGRRRRRQDRAAGRISSSRIRRIGRSSARASSGSTRRTRSVGKAIYGIDIRLPGMLYAAIKACPVNGGKVKSFDAAKITGRKGVKKVVQVEDYAVAVIADSWWHAKTALDALPIEWDEGDNAKVSSESIAAWLKEGLDADQAFVGNKGGDVKAALGRRRQEGRGGLRLSLSAPCHHGAAERHRALHGRQVRGLVLDAERRAALATASEACGLPVPKCEVYKTFLGGGFGRRSTSQDYVRQAVLIAKEMPGTPIKLLWTREEDMTHGWYHPITQCKLTGGI